jgi:hypothetical protein
LQKNPPAMMSELFGDDAVAAAMTDRLVHQAEVIGTNGTQNCS